MRATRGRKVRTRKTRRQKGGGIFSNLKGGPLSDESVGTTDFYTNILNKLHTPDTLVLTTDDIQQLLKEFETLYQLLDKNTDTFAEELMSSKSDKAKEVLQILMPDLTKQQIDDLLHSAAVNTNTATKAEMFKPKSRVGNLFRATNTGANYKGPVTAATRTNAASIKFYEESKAQIKKRLDALLQEINSPTAVKIKDIIKNTIETLKDTIENPPQTGGGDPSLNDIINSYVSTHREIPINRQLLAILYGVVLIGVRVGGIAALAGYSGMIITSIQLAVASLQTAVIAAKDTIILTGKILGAIVAFIFVALGIGAAHGASFAGTEKPPAPTIVNPVAITTAIDPVETRNPILNKPYEFVITRLTKGMRIPIPFVKINLPFHLLPTPDAIRYIMSFFLYKSPTLEPYGPEVSILYQDSAFDKAIKAQYTKLLPGINGETFNKDGSELYGFIGNLFVGNGLPYTVIPYNTIIDDRERPWTYDRSNSGFKSMLASEHQKKTSTWVGYFGMGLNPNKIEKTIPNRSREHPAYALNVFSGFRNAVYVAARWKLTNTPNDPFTVVNPLRTTDQPLPPGWVEQKDRNETWYVCSKTGTTRWERPKEPC